MKKLLCILLALALLFSLSAPVYAFEEFQLFQMEHSYCEDIIQGIQKMVSVKYSSIGTGITVTKGLSVYNADTGVSVKLLPVFVDDQCVGVVHLDSSENFVLSSDTTIYDAVFTLEPDQYILYVTDGVYYAESDDAVIILGTTGFVVSRNAVFSDLTFDEKVTEINTYGNYSMEPVSSVVNEWFAVSTGVSARAVVPGLQEEICDITDFVDQGNYGLCWAACVATIVNYKKNLSLTAINVADRVGIGYDDGANIIEITDALGEYGLTYSYNAGKAPWSNSKAKLQADRPFIIALTSEIGGHALTVYGFYCNQPDSSSGIRYWYVWEPNGSHMTIRYSSSSVDLWGYDFSWHAYTY